MAELERFQLGIQVMKVPARLDDHPAHSAFRPQYPPRQFPPFSPHTRVICPVSRAPAVRVFAPM